jgi:hypothetical protein
MQVPFKANDREYTLSALTFGDFQSLLKTLQYRDYYQIKEDAEKIPELAGLVEETAVRCAKNPVGMDDLGSALNAGAIDVLTEIVFLSLEKHHKDIKRSEAAKLVTIGNGNEIVNLIMDVSGVADDEDENPSKNPQAAVKD